MKSNLNVTIFIWILMILIVNSADNNDPLAQTLTGFETTRVLQLNFTCNSGEALNTSNFYIPPISMAEPEGYCVDKEGDIYFIDTWNGQIKSFDKYGEFIRAFGEYDTFQQARHIAVDKNNNFYVITRWKDSSGEFVLKQFNNKLKFMKKLSYKKEKFASWFLSVDNGNRLHVADPDNGEVIIFGQNRNSESRFKIPVAKGIWSNKIFITREGQIISKFRKKNKDIIDKIIPYRTAKKDKVVMYRKNFENKSITFIEKPEGTEVGPIAINNCGFILIVKRNIIKILDFDGNTLAEKELSFKPIPGARFVEGMDGYFYIQSLEFDESKKTAIRSLWRIKLTTDN